MGLLYFTEAFRTYPWAKQLEQRQLLHLSHSFLPCHTFSFLKMRAKRRKQQPGSAREIFSLLYYWNGMRRPWQEAKIERGKPSISTQSWLGTILFLGKETMFSLLCGFPKCPREEVIIWLLTGTGTVFLDDRWDESQKAWFPFPFCHWYLHKCGKSQAPSVLAPQL